MFISQLGSIQSVAEGVRRGRLRWFGHLEHESGDKWVSACRNVEVAGEKCVGRGRKTWRVVVSWYSCSIERFMSKSKQNTYLESGIDIENHLLHAHLLKFKKKLTNILHGRMPL